MQALSRGGVVGRLGLLRVMEIAKQWAFNEELSSRARTDVQRSCQRVYAG